MDRRQLGEEIYRQKFETFGLSERFDFIRREWSKDHDKRFWARCKNCGEMCDMNDRSWSKFSGPLYPSIDHIIPMAKGGGHTWDNVQVAHIICNSYKGDKND